MFIHKMTKQLILLENENKMLKVKEAKDKADLDYIAMMTDVEIPEEREVENE